MSICDVVCLHGTSGGCVPCHQGFGSTREAALVDEVVRLRALLAESESRANAREHAATMGVAFDEDMWRSSHEQHLASVQFRRQSILTAIAELKPALLAGCRGRAFLEDEDERVQDLGQEMIDAADRRLAQLMQEPARFDSDDGHEAITVDLVSVHGKLVLPHLSQMLDLLIAKPRQLLATIMYRTGREDAEPTLFSRDQTVGRDVAYYADVLEVATVAVPAWELDEMVDNDQLTGAGYGTLDGSGQLLVGAREQNGDMWVLRTSDRLIAARVTWCVHGDCKQVVSVADRYCAEHRHG